MVTNAQQLAEIVRNRKCESNEPVQSVFCSLFIYIEYSKAAIRETLAESRKRPRRFCPCLKLEQ